MLLLKVSLNFLLTLTTKFFVPSEHTIKMEEELKNEIAELKRELAEKNAAIESLVIKLRAYECTESIQVSDGLDLPILQQSADLANTDIAKFSRLAGLP